MVGVLHPRHRHLARPAAATLTLLLFTSAAVSLFLLGSTGEAAKEPPERKLTAVHQMLFRVGPGSSPPTCQVRCGSCWPCKPVRIAIHPGLNLLPQEYYPEAWRCKCGNKLFMP
ncbi:hypothetical protein SAY87_023654 [Trapa incisa]|uniref:Epidermal patterning factor-like protein n=1 Tax=Trapa incisa TaxID=236973 RepID=A0AAN7KSX7_9MYRT|nr:hypothetical protein SAY87_023654 [Trapa incisa]